MSASRPHRRQFGKAVAAAVVGSACADAADTPATGKAPPLADVARAQLAIVKAQYGAFLDAEQLTRLQARLLGNLQSARRLRSMKLTNADEPAVTFTPDVP